MIEDYENRIYNLYYNNNCLSADIGSLNNLKGNLTDLINKLDKEVNKLDNFSSNIVNYYSIDNAKVDKKIANNKDNINSVISYIKGIITGIESKVFANNKTIEDNNNSIWYYNKKINELKENGE